MPLLIVGIPACADAGLRAVYDLPLGMAAEVRVADNGDLVASLQDGTRLFVRDGEAFLVEDRLTGPLVTRLADMDALAAEKTARAALGGEEPALVPAGTETVRGRKGRAYREQGGGSGKPELVISADPELGALSGAMRRVIAAEELIGRLRDGDSFASSGLTTVLDVLSRGAPLRVFDRELQSAEHTSDDVAAFALPVEPESTAAYRARVAAEAAEEEAPRDNENMERAVFFDGKLWLLSDKGTVSSMPDGGGALTRHDLGAEVADLCAGPSGLTAVGAPANEGGAWTIHRWQENRWQQGRRVPSDGDRLVALSCGSGEVLLVTSGRLVPVDGGKPLVLSSPMKGSLVQTSVHATSDAVFLGFNSGEWGGGVQRINRRTGKVTVVERNATGGLCDGPLNTACDPVHGFAEMPWRPGCTAAAIGLVHMMARGRIAQLCGDQVEQFHAEPYDRLSNDPKKQKEASAGGYGAVPFFALARRGDVLLAAGADGLYRIEGPGKVTRTPWPRFKWFGDLLISFEDPDAVLVLTGMNGRASVGGLAPLMAVR